MASLTPDEKKRKAQLDKLVIEQGASIDPNLRKELTQLNDKATGTLSEGIAELSSGLSNSWDSAKNWLNNTPKGMEAKPEAPLPPRSTLDNMFGSTSSLSPVPPTAQKEIEKKNVAASSLPTTPAVVPPPVVDKKKEVDLPSAMNSVIASMQRLPQDMRNQFDKPMQEINNTISGFNEQYQADQASAKDKTEKAKNRAEWASIASMLAKNIVGYAAALHGVDPNAMAYQTTDWEKHIQGINDELNLNLGNLRDSMKMKVEQKLGEKKDIQSNMDDTFKGKMEALRTKAGALSEQARIDSQMERDRLDNERRLSETKAKEDATTTKIEPPGKELDAAMGVASDKKTFEKGIGSLKALAARYSINPAEIDSVLKKYDTGFLGMGKGNEMTPEAQNEISQLFDNKYRQLVTTKSSSGVPSGQSPAPVVQSGSVPMFKDGKQYNIPADKVEAAKAKGYTLQ